MVGAVFALCHEYVSGYAELDPVYGGERARLSAREEARARDRAAFDLRRWHAAALDVGPIGLGLLPSALREAGAARVAG